MTDLEQAAVEYVKAFTYDTINSCSETSRREEEAWDALCALVNAQGQEGADAV